MRNEIARNEDAVNQSTNYAFEKSTWWFDNMTTFLNILFEIQTELATEILRSLDGKLWEGWQSRERYMPWHEDEENNRENMFLRSAEHRMYMWELKDSMKNDTSREPGTEQRKESN